MANGNILAATFPLELDYLAPSDTTLTLAADASFGSIFSDNFTFTIVDPSGRNSKRKLVGVATLRELT